jgi:NADPH:quinone reductase-like Zn-dependent oxidoreductase
MKAIVCTQYGPPDVLQFTEVAKPTPKDDEVLTKVHGASLNPIDQLFRGKPYAIRILTGLRKPKDTRIGSDVAGKIEAVGRNVTRFNQATRYSACAVGPVPSMRVLLKVNWR